MPKDSSERDWDAEMAKIDRQIAATSPEKLAAPADRKALPAPKQAGGTVQHQHKPMAAWARLVLGLALGVGMLFWPYPAHCGPWLGLYLLGVTVLTAGGVWASV